MNLFTKLTQWYFSKKALPYWCVFGLDCVIVLFCHWLVYLLDYNTAIPQRLGLAALTLAIYLLCYVIGFRLFHTYSSIIRYSSFVDLQRVGMAVFCGFGCILICKAALPGTFFIDGMRIKDLALSAVLSIMLMWTVRVLVKYLYDSTYQLEHAKRIFIYGVKQGGISLAKSIRNQDPAKYVLSGFVSDEADIQHRMLMGVGVYANDNTLVAQMRKKGAGILFVSPLKGETLRGNTEMVNLLIGNGIKIFMVPSAQEWDGKSEVTHTQLKEIEIEDLLPRERIEIDLAAVKEQLARKVILITGAAGSIGSEVVRQVAQFSPRKLVLVDQAETPLHDIRLMMARQWPELEALTIVSDICVEERMEGMFNEYRPDYVFHAAAYKHVPMMEDNPGESIRNNVHGTKIIADLAVKYGTKKFVMISTDKAVNPTNVMGCSKRICEIYVQSLDKAIKEGKVDGATQFVTTRFGNVLGSNGSVIPLFKEQIKHGGPVTVTHPDIIRFFMLIPEACKLVLEAGAMGHGGEIFAFDMGEPVRIVNLAKRMILLSGAEHVEIKFTGLRDGEKLYEEVLNEKETAMPTFHPKIKIARVREYDYAEIDKQIGELVRHSLTDDDMAIVRRMKEMVPEFISQHSAYEALDKGTTAQT